MATTTQQEIKEYLGEESVRNRNNGQLFTALVREAYGCDHAVLIGHHICFQRGSDISTENEIPSADSLIFDHTIMGNVFGTQAVPIMQRLAALDCDNRDQRLAAYYAAHCNGVKLLTL